MDGGRPGKAPQRLDLIVTCPPHGLWKGLWIRLDGQAGLRAMDWLKTARFSRNSSSPLPIIGVRRAVMQCVVHDDARRAPDGPARESPSRRRRLPRLHEAQSHFEEELPETWTEGPPMPMPSVFYPSNPVGWSWTGRGFLRPRGNDGGIGGY